MAKENTQFRSMQDCPGFLRELVAEKIGVPLEKVNGWIDTDDDEGIELIEIAVLELDDALNEPRQLEAAQGGAS